MIENRKIKKGDIFLADLDHTVGCEQKGIRPVVVIQNNIGNKFSPTLIIAPLTSRTPTTNDLPTHVELLKSNTLLRYNSIVLLEQIRTIDRIRLKGYVCSISDDDMKMIEKSIKVSLGIK